MKIIVTVIRRHLENIDLNAVHFCRQSKARYRLHLTIGVISTSAISAVGIAYNHPGLAYAAIVMNAVTAIIWVWE